MGRFDCGAAARRRRSRASRLVLYFSEMAQALREAHGGDRAQLRRLVAAGRSLCAFSLRQPINNCAERTLASTASGERLASGNTLVKHPCDSALAS